MSIMDDIRRLRTIASYEIPIERIRLIEGDLVGLNAEVAEILGPGSGFAHGIGECAARIGEHLDAAIAACNDYEAAIHDAADRIERSS